MIVSMLFPPELLYNIVKYTNINEVRKVCISLCPGISSDTLESIEKERKSPGYVFSSAFENVPELTEAMIMSDTALSGFRAFNYFVPINIKDSDTWEFYCDYHPSSCDRFIEYLDSIGIKWFGESESDDALHSTNVVYRLKGYKSQGKSAQIHVCWPNVNVSCCTGEVVYEVASTGVSTHNCAIWGNKAQMPNYSRSLNRKGNVCRVTSIHSKGYIHQRCKEINSKAEALCNRYKENGITFSENTEQYGYIEYLFDKFLHVGLSVNFDTVLQFERPRPLCVRHMIFFSEHQLDTYQETGVYEKVI